MTPFQGLLGVFHNVSLLRKSLFMSQCVAWRCIQTVLPRWRFASKPGAPPGASISVGASQFHPQKLRKVARKMDKKKCSVVSINEPSGREEVCFPNLKLVPLPGRSGGPVPASPTCPVPTVFGELLHSYVKLSAGFLHICSSRSQPDVPCESI